MQRDVKSRRGGDGRWKAREGEREGKGVVGGNTEKREERKGDERKERLTKTYHSEQNVWKATGISSFTSSSVLTGAFTNTYIPEAYRISAWRITSMCILLKGETKGEGGGCHRISRSRFKNKKCVSLTSATIGNSVGCGLLHCPSAIKTWLRISSRPWTAIKTNSTP